MQKTNYNEIMKETIKGFSGRKTLFLHSCCGPCSSAVIEKLANFFNITIFYYNPNILPFEEYEKRKEEQKRLIVKLNENLLNKINFVEGEYKVESFACAIKGYEALEEGSERCKQCYQFRLQKTAELASEKGFGYFSTTLSVSPHKNATWINEILLELGEKLKKENSKTLPLLADFKKENGYLRSLELAKEYNLYRQNYCGCRPNKDV